MLAALPDELLLHVFSRCSACTLGRIRRVSKPWRAISDHDSLWRLFSCTRSVALCGEQLPPTLAMGSYRRARALFAHTCSQCAAAARAPVGFPSPKHSHLQDVRAQLVRQWTLTGAQLAAAGQQSCGPDLWTRSSNQDQTGPLDEGLRYCALWMTRHGPRYWMRVASKNDVVCANPNDVSTTDELLKWSACIADEARECLLGACDVDGWMALPVALPDEEARTSCSHPLLTPAPHEWQRLERWLLSLVGTDARAADSHTGFPPDPRHVGTLRASVALELEMRRSILALERLLAAGDCVLIIPPNDLLMTSSRLLAAGDCILVFSVGLGPVDQIIGQGVRPGRQWQRVHRDGRSARPFRHSLGDEPPLPNRDDAALPSGGAVIELVAVHLRTGRQCFLSQS